MIAHLCGDVILSRPNYLILDVGGVGYKIHTPVNTSVNVVTDANFFIHEHIREDARDLYGFKDWQSLELFELLISVNGVGPKAGLAILSNNESQEIVNAILREDLTFFMAVPGIGKKVAAKIILELKSKISGIEGSGVLGKMDASSDIFEALLSLGYRKAEIQTIVGKIPAEVESTDDKIRWCLKSLSKV